MANFGIDSNLVFDADGKSVAARLSDHDTSLDGLTNYKTYKSVKEFGAISDCNYYNSADNNYYKDSSFTTLATDNTTFFQTALDSGYNIILDGNFLLGSTVQVNKTINIISNNGNVYMKSNLGTSGIKIMFTLNVPISIEGVNFYSKNNQQLEMSLRAENGGVWDATQGYSSNIICLNLLSSNCTIKNCIGNEVEFLVHANPSTVIENINIRDCRVNKAFIGIGLGNVINSFIINCSINMETTLGTGTPHAIYLWGGCVNVQINNCYLYNEANMISFIRVKINNSNIYIQNCIFECKKTKCIIAVECTGGTNTVTLNGCKSIDCRGLFSNLQDGNCSIRNCEFLFDNNIATNPISQLPTILENTGASTLTITNSSFNAVYYASSVLNIKNMLLRNVTYETKADASISNVLAFSSSGTNKIFNSTISVTGRFYVYGSSGVFDVYNSSILSTVGGELSYLTSIAHFYKCILSTVLVSTNSQSVLVDATKI
jgi:hypothetical protein